MRRVSHPLLLVTLTGLLVTSAVAANALPRTPQRVSHRASQLESQRAPRAWHDSHAVGHADTIVVNDPIARLQRRLDAGEAALERDSTFGYLPALLKALNIPVSSQGLVFSRTSLQTDKIAPWAPRALYFNDDVYVGYVQESHFLEIASIDPNAGAVFYTLSQEPRARPQFTRETTTCLMCHQSKAATGGVPGVMVISTIADRNGYPIVGVHSGTTTDQTPIAQRFGGWYVTGSTGPHGHAGNVVSPLLGHEVYDKQHYRETFDMTAASTRTDLAGMFDSVPYLSRHSDLVALMVLVHQTSVHNLITAAHDAATEYVRYDPAAAGGGRPANTDAYVSESAVRMQRTIDLLVRGLLMVGEAAPLAPLRGTSGFAEEFARAGGPSAPRDGQGRSLRDLDLEHRLFKYPLSFLIYSDSFESMPLVARRAVYARLWQVFNGTDPDPEYQRIAPADRAAMREILMATKPEFAGLRPR